MHASQHIHLLQIKVMKNLLFFLLFLIFSCSSAIFVDEHAHFLECLSHESDSSISNIVYTRANTSYTSILQFSIRNHRYESESTPKPEVIITPKHESQIPPVIFCAKHSGLEIRTRSGGHDFEGLSYVSRVPFVIIDLIDLSEITVDPVGKTAWVGAGATLGLLYYKIAEKSPVLGFPAGLCPTVGVGGHFSGGGYGLMLRKYGLAGDNVIDAKIVDVSGRILDRKSMGEDLFWAIRGGGAASFGVITAWKVQLVDVPETVTVFSIVRTLEQNATQLVHRWQYVASKLEPDLFIGILLSRVNSTQGGSNITIGATFYSIFLGGIDRLVPMLQESFPELGVVKEDCSEMSWIESAVYFSQLSALSSSVEFESVEILLNRTPPTIPNLKMKSDYVKKPIPRSGIQGMVRLLYQPEAEEAVFIMIPYGGRMAEIPESETPFPHRGGNLFKLACVVYWPDDEGSERYISWSREYYSYMTPYVSRNPRQAYLNYRDLDIGVNDIDGETSYAQASVWGKKYFNNNFDRLVRVKSIVDPENFFKNEQTIPPSYSRKGIKMHSSKNFHGSNRRYAVFASK